MYSLVLLTALAPGADVTPTPAAVDPVVVGCHGCVGVPVSYGCVGCYGCAGCYGVVYHRPLRHCFFGFCKRSCLGCVGYSCVGYNCFGTCLGCSGCLGCMGCVGVVTSYGPAVVMPPYSPPAGGMSPQSVYGPVTNPNGSPMKMPETQPKPMTEPKVEMPKGSAAHIRFQLPGNARLFVDGRPTTLTGSDRAFVTPPLARGQKFFYDVRAELELDGALVVEEKRVIVEAGADLIERFPKLFAALEKSANTTTVAGK